MTFISHLRSRTVTLWVLLVALILSGCGALIREMPGGAPTQGVPGGAPIQATPGDAPTQEASMFRANPARTGVFPSDGPTTLSELVWTFKTDVRNVGFVSSPAIADGVVYVGSEDGRLYALDAATGQEKWSLKTDGEVYSSPAVAGGMVYVGSGDGRLDALDAETGQEKWSFKTDGEVYSSPAVAGGVVYFVDTEGYLYAVR